jgi:hypothetical protein
MSENVGASTSRNPKGLRGLYGDNFTFTQFVFTLPTATSELLHDFFTRFQLKKLKLRGFSPQAKYTDRACFQLPMNVNIY